jgi:hypothetical protein
MQKAICCRIFTPAARSEYPAASLRDYCCGVLTSIHNWDKIEEFESIENIPEDLRKSLLLDGYLIYSKARGPD